MDGCLEPVKLLNNIFDENVPATIEFSWRRRLKALATLGHEKKIHGVVSTHRSYVQILTYHQVTGLVGSEEHTEQDTSSEPKQFYALRPSQLRGIRQNELAPIYWYRVAYVIPMPDMMDVYFVNSAGRTCTHSVSEAVSTGQDNWRTLDNLEAPPYFDISAISCVDSQVKFFLTDVESRICTVAWKTSTGNFSDWIQVAGGRAHPGSPVTAISRAKGKADVFVVGSDQRVYTTVCNFLDNSVEWQPIGDLQVPSGLRVTPVLHSKDEVDVFVIEL